VATEQQAKRLAEMQARRQQARLDEMALVRHLTQAHPAQRLARVFSAQSSSFVAYGLSPTALVATLSLATLLRSKNPSR
jgi:hypothetical protein